MKVLSDIKDFFLKVWRSQALKYAVVCVAGILIVGFLDENSVWNHMKNLQRIGELEDEIGDYNDTYQRNQAQIHELNRNPKAMERIARERYFMKADDEDIFILSDDDRASQLIKQDETTE